MDGYRRDSGGITVSTGVETRNLIETTIPENPGLKSTCRSAALGLPQLGHEPAGRRGAGRFGTAAPENT